MKVTIQTSDFLPAGSRAAGEYHSFVRIAESGAPFSEQAIAIIMALNKISADRDLQFVRFFLSDAANQQDTLISMLNESSMDVPFSIIRQTPLDNTKIAAWVYSTDRHTSAYRMIWTGNMTAGGGDSEVQMSRIFHNYEELLQNEHASVRDDAVRTWIYVRDVDVNYAGVVKGRREYFDRIGLGSDTHYIASTGIEGCDGDCSKLVKMDALAIKGLDRSQIQYLYAPGHLSRTSDYGVTFERGTAIHFGDRVHCYISGTASIDKNSQVVHVGNVVLQTERLVENIGALLAEAGASTADIQMAIVYLRDYSDYATVRDTLERLVPQMNVEFVLAPVCRTAWLVEMECIAIREEKNSFPAF